MIYIDLLVILFYSDFKVCVQNICSHFYVVFLFCLLEYTDNIFYR
jgi:hypothetical protein